MEKIDRDKLLFLLKKKNVVGFSTQLHNKIVGGKEVPIRCIRVYVEKKVPKEQLSAEDLVPLEIDGIYTDVVEIGRIVAYKSKQEFDPKARIRPITAGISAGNVKITANTIGYFYQDKNGNRYMASNAHCWTDDPFADQPSATEILQPGPYDGGKLPDDLVGHYVMHVKLFPGDTGQFNKLDFSLATIEVDCDYKIWQTETPTKLVGHLFAGSDQVTVIFKGKYIADLGYTPINADIVEVQVGDYVEKWGRTTGHTVGKVLDTSAVVKVYYSQDKYALFDNQILTTSISAGGDSGSSVWLSSQPPAPPPYPLRKGKWVIKGRLWFIPFEMEFKEVEENEL